MDVGRPSPTSGRTLTSRSVSGANTWVLDRASGVFIRLGRFGKGRVSVMVSEGCFVPDTPGSDQAAFGPAGVYYG